MLKNYFRTAWRSLVNHPFYSLLNISGLAIGLTVGILILIWVNDERSFDTQHRKADQIYRINTALGTGISKGVYPVLQAPMGPLAVKEVPGVQAAVRLNTTDDYAILRYQDRELKAPDMFYTDPGFFKMFDFKLLKGSVDKPFHDEHSVIITESIAHRFFGNAEPLGKTVVADGKQPFVVSGVLADFPENSSIQGDMIFSTALYNQRYTAASFWKGMDNDWGNYGWRIFLQIQPGVSIGDIEKKLTAINVRNQPTLKPIDVGAYVLQPLKNIHLYAPDGSSSGMQTVGIFTLIAIFILLIASINYINLSTARAILRSREVSIRKVIGAARRQLITQFVLETALFFFIAVVVSFCCLIPMAMPLFNSLSGKDAHFSLLDPALWKVAGITVGICTLASSIYPATLLSSFRPIEALKGKLNLGGGNTRFRKGLVVCQFVFSISLIIGTLIVNRQLSYIRGKELGYDKTHVFSFDMKDMRKNYPAIRAQLLTQPGVQDITSADNNIIYIGGSTLDVDWDGKDKKESFFIHAASVDAGFMPMFKMQLTKGSGFTGSLADSMHYIVNETTVREGHITDPIGKKFVYRGIEGTIIGVAKDFHFAPLREKIQPFVFYYRPDSRKMFVKTTGKGAPDAIRAVEKLWAQYNTKYPLEYHFLDESYDRLYKSDQRTGSLFDVFASIAVLISCLGLFGLATYSAHVKVKEIGIRKVLGASVADILVMLSHEFLLLVGLAICIALPLAGWAMSHWLQDFAYRAPLTWWVFASAAAGALLITLLTVSAQALRAALANPIRSLRSE